MIQALNSILSDICTINEKKNIIVIMPLNSVFPEDYIEVDYREKLIKIKEIHRSNEKNILETENTNEACAATCVLALRLFSALKRDEVVEQLRTLIKENFFEEAHRLLDKHLSTNDYSIGKECYDKVSLIEAGANADVKYHSEYLAKSAGLPRAYVVLYNYSKKKSFIETWCAENIALVNNFVDADKLVELYMFGYIK